MIAGLETDAGIAAYDWDHGFGQFNFFVQNSMNLFAVLLGPLSFPEPNEMNLQLRCPEMTIDRFRHVQQVL
jgi:hypothetical protein